MNCKRVGLVVCAAACVALGPLAHAFTLDDVTFWTGTGAQRAALVIDWDPLDAGTDSSYAWGYKWDGGALGEDMVRALSGSGDFRAAPLGTVLGPITGSDPRLGVQLIRDLSWGNYVYGLGYDVDNDGGFEYVIDPVTSTGGPADPDDLYHEGWFGGYWNLQTSTDGSNWAQSMVGLTSLPLTDGLLVASVWDAEFRTFYGQDLPPGEPRPADPPAGGPPVAEANGPYTINMYDGTVTLDATGSYDPDGDDLAFVWAVGDHAAAEMTDPLYTLSWADFISTFGYMGCGDYAVTLSVRDTTGLWGADASSITVTPEPCTLMLLAGGCLALCRRRRR